MGSLFKPPRCKCGREMKLNGGGTGYRPCVCAPRPRRPKVDLRPTESKARDLLVEDERQYVERAREGWPCTTDHLLRIIDRLAPGPKDAEEVPS